MVIARVKRKLEKHIEEARKGPSSPHAIALGFAIGSFVAILPTFGFDVLILILIALITKRINRLALFGGLAFWNPITMIPVQFVSYQIGNALLGSAPAVGVPLTFLEHAFSIGKRVLLGSSILSVVLAAASYLVVRLVAEAYVKKHRAQP